MGLTFLMGFRYSDRVFLRALGPVAVIPIEVEMGCVLQPEEQPFDEFEFGHLLV